VLDDFDGLGDVRRGALMAHFGDIDRLKAASAAEIRDVEGFGPKLAVELYEFLHRPTPLPALPAAAMGTVPPMDTGAGQGA